MRGKSEGGELDEFAIMRRDETLAAYENAVPAPDDGSYYDEESGEVVRPPA